jgi:hypothetical protein
VRIEMNRSGAAALVVGSLAYVLILAVHPSHPGGQGVGHLSFSSLVHGLGLLIGPVLTFGVLVLARELDPRRPAVLLAAVFYAFGAVVGALAPVMSGLVAEQLMEAALAAPERREAFRSLGALIYFQNQGFAHVHAAFVSIAIVLLSLSWPGRGPSVRGLQLLGVAVGAGVLAWQLSGHLRLDIHGTLAVVLAHGAWTIAAAVWLWRRAPAPAA